VDRPRVPRRGIAELIPDRDSDAYRTARDGRARRQVNGHDLVLSGEGKVGARSIGRQREVPVDVRGDRQDAPGEVVHAVASYKV
jgi:hypothetical protein